MKIDPKIYKILAIILIMLLVAGLATTLGILVNKEQKHRVQMGAVYDEAYYACLDGLGDLENKLSKLQVTRYPKTQKNLLQEAYTDCEVIGVSLARLSDKNLDSGKLLKFINQLGGFSYYLSQKLPDEPITTEENQKLIKLTEVVTALEKAFAEAGEQVAVGGSLYDELGEGIKTLQGVYDAFDQTTVDYPEMIYDGPFSEGLLDREAKFLKDKEAVSVDTVRERLTSVLGEVGEQGETEGAIPSYLFSIGEGSVEVSKVGGYIVEYSIPHVEGEYTATVEQVINTATVFLSYIGYNDMQAVWASENDGLVYINFAYVKDDVIYYPDLIKVKISLTESKIVGLEAQNYLYNHTERTLESDVKSIDEITVKEGFEVSSKRLTVIPTEWNTEILAYEVAGSYNDSRYYIYYDAKTLEEIKVMRVIKDENQGELIV